MENLASIADRNSADSEAEPEVPWSDRRNDPR